MRCLTLTLLAGALATLPLRAEVEVGRILVKNGILFTMQADETSPRRGYLLAGDDGKILRVGYGDPPPGIRAVQTLDASGRFVVPGFVSAHSHLYQAATRGLAPDKELGGWLRAGFPYWRASLPADHYFQTLAGCFDLLAHGVTTAFNFNDENGDDVEGFRAELASGLRFVHGFCLPMEGTRKSRQAAFDAFYAYTRPFAGKTAFLGLALGGYAFAAGDEDYIRLEGEIMQRYGLYNEAHYLEAADPSEVAAQRSRFGWFRESGELGPRLSFGHLVHPDSAILDQIASAGAGMVWNPLSNGRLGSGLADIPAIAKRGIRIGMGVDGQASADLSDPFENMRAGLYGVRARYESASVLLPRDVLGFHTRGSADVIGVLGRVGTLEKGKFADFLIVDPHRLETGPVFDPYATLVLACSASNIEKVFVGARLVVENGNCLNPDYAHANAEVLTRMARIRASLETPGPR